jgi:hypothetical protein
MTLEDLQEIMVDLEWLKSEHPERKTLIEFCERFKKFLYPNGNADDKAEDVGGASDARLSCRLWDVSTHRA